MRKSLFVFLFGMFTSFNAVSQHQAVNWDKFLYSGPGLKQIGWLETKPAKDIKSSPWWSIGCETLDRDYAKFSTYREYVGELGIKHARIQSGWAKCEKVKGVYNFTWLDSIVYGLAEQSITPWITLCYGNPVYNSDHRLKAKLFTDEETMNAWLNYVEAIVVRYKDVVKEWEIWNEPNNGNKEYEPYTSLLIKTAEKIREIQPDAVIVGFALYKNPIDYTKGALEILKSKNKLGLVDYISYHPYTLNPDRSYKDVVKFKELIQSYSSNIKLLQGENGCPSNLEWGHALRGYPWTEVSQAKWVLRRMAGDRMHDIRSSVFTIIDLKYPNMLQSFGLIRSNLLNEFIYKRPSFYGVQHMASFFDYTVKRTPDLNYSIYTSLGGNKYSSDAYQEMTVAGYKKENKNVILLWYSDDIPSDNFEWNLVDLTLKGANFEDPVYVEMISGKVFEFNEHDWMNSGNDVKFENLPVWDSVIMITERSQVNSEE